MASNAVRLERVLRAAPEHVYRAFLDARAVAKWLPPYGYTCEVQRMEAKVGGCYRLAFANFGTGRTLVFGGEYLELIEGQRIRYSDRFESPWIPGEMATTVTLQQRPGGTAVNIVQEGLPVVFPVETCHRSWQQSLAQLATLVEPDVE